MQPMKRSLEIPLEIPLEIVPTPNVSIFQMLQFSKENDEPKKEDPECWVRGINQSLLQQEQNSPNDYTCTLSVFIFHCCQSNNSKDSQGNKYSCHQLVRVPEIKKK